MKKNFLAIASLLIAAMLLMVSCNQEVAPKNNLVEAKLNVAYGRDLTVTGNTDTSNVVLKYTMIPAWVQDGVETIYGGTSKELNEQKTAYVPTGDPDDLKPNGSVGYVTPGLWTIHVYAYENEGSKTRLIFDGEANAYFSNLKTVATVYLAPTSNQKNQIVFNITMQDLVGDDVIEENTGSGSFELVYNIYSTSGTEKKISSPLEKKDPVNHISSYEGTVSNLESGFYRVNVSIYSVRTKEQQEEERTLVGGITKGFLLSGEKTATVSGHIEPSDYENVSINAVYVDVKTTLSVDNVIADDKGTYKVTYSGSDVEVTVTMNDSETVVEDGLNYTKTLLWSAISDKKESQGTQTANDNSQKFTFKTPGYKYITCTTVYDVTGHVVDESGNRVEEHYYFADTQTVRVFVEPASTN